MNRNRHPVRHPVRNAAVLATAAAALLLLGACNRQDDRSVGQKVDSAVATVEKKAEEAKAATERAADQAGQKVENAAARVGDAVSDAAITASVNGELAKDDKLSALKINVDTSNGRVTLTGKAPDADSRERATRLAAGVKGVTNVENRLEIGS
ncbi:MAG: BON domain-containing protein [Proteobacteria bacterium]|nr:BON domain-containing protein [Pseudomonadota bacterium]